MARKKPEVLSFEKALEQLETTVRQLEGDQVSLDESLKLFEDGVRLSRQCTEALDKAEQRVLTLVEGGKLTSAGLDAGSTQA